MHTRRRAQVVLFAAFTSLVLLVLPVRSASAAPGLCNKGQGAFGPAGYSVTVAPSGTSAPVGTAHTITATVLDRAGAPVASFCLDFLQNAGPSTGWPMNATTDAAGQASVTWTSGAVGTDSITGSYTDSSGARVGGTIRHTWTPKPTPSPTPSPSPLPPPPTRTPSPLPSVSPTPSQTPSATSSPTPSPTPSATASPTATPTPTPTPSPTATPSPPPVLGTFGDGSIQLNHPSALPGGTVTVTGRNCPAGSAVSFTVEGTPGGTAKAAPDGTFQDTVQLPDTTLGRHLVEVTCQGRRASIPIDLVVSSSTSSPAAGATVLAILVFFVLLGSILFTRGTSRRRTVTEVEPT